METVHRINQAKQARKRQRTVRKQLTDSVVLYTVGHTEADSSKVLTRSLKRALLNIAIAEIEKP